MGPMLTQHRYEFGELRQGSSAFCRIVNPIDGPDELFYGSVASVGRPDFGNLFCEFRVKIIQVVRRVFVIIGCVRQHSTIQIKCSVSMLTVEVNVNKYKIANFVASYFWDTMAMLVSFAAWYQKVDQIEYALRRPASNRMTSYVYGIAISADSRLRHFLGLEFRHYDPVLILELVSSQFTPTDYTNVRYVSSLEQATSLVPRPAPSVRRQPAFEKCYEIITEWGSEEIMWMSMEKCQNLEKISTEVSSVTSHSMDFRNEKPQARPGLESGLPA
ncbi:hypothetical protein ANN_17876 [Periplaneta americana]|uniref:Uncharacterized protein n=1 Tax=Periplaneta americana TaxID=6978 RepID=A0ABQ8SVI0_PERAM|nr:hypothetical protein ANN_17876 [Periplaneta americana]